MSKPSCGLLQPSLTRGTPGWANRHAREGLPRASEPLPFGRVEVVTQRYEVIVGGIPLVEPEFATGGINVVAVIDSDIGEDAHDAPPRVLTCEGDFVARDDDSLAGGRGALGLKVGHFTVPSCLGVERVAPTQVFDLPAVRLEEGGEPLLGEILDLPPQPLVKATSLPLPEGTDDNGAGPVGPRTDAT